MEFELEKSEGDDNGYCLVQLIEKGGTVRRVISRIWMEQDEEHPGRQKVRYWTHAAEKWIGTLARNRTEAGADEYMRSCMGLSSG